MSYNDEEFTTIQASKFSELPEYTQKFLQSMRETEVQDLKEAINFMQSVRTVGIFGKWLIITGVGMFIGLITIGEHINKFKALFFVKGG